MGGPPMSAVLNSIVEITKATKKSGVGWVYPPTVFSAGPWREIQTVGEYAHPTFL
jgi:hypothetical protein